jgi:hypothetical protein
MRTLLAVLILLLPLAQSQSSEAPLVVHEFGYLWEEGLTEAEVTVHDLLGDLPSHVRDESKETPLDVGDITTTTTVGDPFLFFYAEQPLTVDVEVAIPEGRPVAWFPRATEYRSDRLLWRDISVTQKKPDRRRLKPLRPSEHRQKWQGLTAARKVTGSSFLEVGTQVEKYLFYESALPYPPALLHLPDQPRQRRGAPPTSFRVRNTRPFPLLDLYVFPGLDDPRQQVAYVHTLAPDAVLEISFAETSEDDSSPVQWLTEPVEQHLDGRMQQLGLFPEEAQLCVDTVLEPAFLQSRGRKAAYRLPRAEYDRLCPVTITPEPRTLIRVGMVLVTDLQHRTVDHYCDVAERGSSQERRRVQPVLASVGHDAVAALEERMRQRRGKYRARLREARDAVAALLDLEPQQH